MSIKTVTLRLVTEAIGLGNTRKVKAELQQLERDGLTPAAKAAGVYRDSLGRLREPNGRFISDTRRAALGLEEQSQKARAAARSNDAVSRSSDLAAKAARGLTIAAIGLSAAFGLRGLTEAQTQIDGITRSLEVGLGSFEAGGRGLAFIRSEAERLGLNLPRAASDLASLQAAAKGTKLEGLGAARVFTAINQTMLALGKSPEVAEGALRAVEQMISKGTVSAEELRGQLGERLPGAFQIAAKAMNLTTAELGDALQKGEIMAEDLLPRLAVALEGRFADAADKAADSLQANVNRMGTALFGLQTAINQAGAADVLNTGAKAITTFLNQLTALTSAQTQAFSSSPAVDWALAIEVATKQVVLFFGRIPDFVKGMVSLIATDIAFMAESFGIGFRAAGVLAERALQGIKDAAIVAVNAALSAVQRLAEGAATALDSLGADQLAAKLRNGAAAIGDFQSIIGEQAAANRRRLDDERDALVAVQANAKRAHDDSRRFIVETISGNEDARQAALDNAGAIKRVGLEAFAAAAGLGEAGKKTAELTDEQKRAAKAAADAKASLAERLETLREENRLLTEGYTIERAREQVRVQTEAKIAGFTPEELAAYLAELRELTSIQDTLLDQQKAARDAAEEESRIRARNLQLIRETVAELEAEVSALLSGAGAAAKYEAQRAKLVAQGATAEQAQDVVNLTRVRDTLQNNRGVVGLDSLDFDQVLDFSPMFDSLDDLEERLESIGGTGSAAMKQISLAAKAFAVAGTASGKQAFGAYTQGAAASLAAVQTFTKEGSSNFEKLGVAIQALHAVTAVQAALNAFATAPFPANFAALAAALAAIASLGVSIGGSAGGVSGAPSAVASSNLGNGTGTVLGDPSAESKSIANSIEQLEKYAETDLGFAAQQLQALRSIQASLAGVSSQLFRANIATGGATPFNLATSERGTFSTGLVNRLASPLVGGAVGGFIDNVSNAVTRAIFGSRKIEQIGTGLILQAGQQLGDVLANGLDAVYFQAIRETRRSFFGLSSSSSTRETTSAIGDDLSRQLALVLGGLADSAVAAVGALGGDVGAARERLNALSLGQVRIDLQGLSAEDAQKRLEAVFGAIGDTIAQALLPGITEFQRAGEGAFETLNRVASETRVVQQRLDSLGLSLGQLTGLDLARVGQQLIDLAGGAENFIANTGTFFTEFFSEEEQTESLRQQLVEAVDALGYALPAARAGFRELITSLDLTSEQGQQAFTRLTALAGAADRYYDTLDEARERYDDAAKSLRNFRNSLRDITEAAVGTTLAASRQRFDSASRLARLGNLQALESLPDIGRAYVAAAAAEAQSRSDYLREIARIQLATSQAEQVAGRLSLNDLATQQLVEQRTQTALLESINGALVSPSTPASFPAKATPDEIAQLREENAELKALLRTVAVATVKMNRYLEQWDNEGLPRERAA